MSVVASFPGCSSCNFRSARAAENQDISSVQVTLSYQRAGLFGSSGALLQSNVARQRAQFPTGKPGEALVSPADQPGRRSRRTWE